MGDAAEWHIEQGQAAWWAHQHGDCGGDFCEYCEAEEAQREKWRKQKRRQRKRQRLAALRGEGRPE